jgi:hypothetical protein
MVFLAVLTPLSLLLRLGFCWIFREKRAGFKAYGSILAEE